MTIEATTHQSVARAFIPGLLPSAVRVLAVTARPGQESADLGGLARTRVSPLWRFLAVRTSLRQSREGNVAARKAWAWPRQSWVRFQYSIASALCGWVKVLVGSSGCSHARQ